MQSRNVSFHSLSILFHIKGHFQVHPIGVSVRIFSYNISLSNVSNLVVHYTVAQLLIDIGIILRAEELVQCLDVSLMVHIATQEIDVTLLQHPASHLARHVAIVACEREDIDLKLDLMLLQIVIELTMMAEVVRITLWVRHNKIISV